MTSVAIIGLGSVTSKLHLPAYGRLRDDVRVIAGCDAEALRIPFFREQVWARLDFCWLPNRRQELAWCDWRPRSCGGWHRMEH